MRSASRLAHAARSGEGHQPAFVQQGTYLGYGRSPADQVGEHGRKVGPRAGRQGGRCPHALKAWGLLQHGLVKRGQGRPRIEAKVVG